MKIYLASRSPRRHELLKQIDVDFEVIDIDIDESIKKALIASLSSINIVIMIQMF